MIDPKDIDALLIGALYSELTPADEARLAAHLDSHPTDRSALDGLRFTREAVRESRILAVQLDPPQAISALLLQEAHRRAPKVVPLRERASDEGWFARFVRSFAAHPAMAAAAMLVLVLGIGGIMYKRHGANQFAESAAPASELALTTPSAGSSAAAFGGGTPGAAAPESDGIVAGKLDQAEGVPVTLADGNTASEKLAKQQQGIEVRTPTLEPKDFEKTPEPKPEPKAPKVATATKTPPPPPRTAPAATGTKNTPDTREFAMKGDDKTVVGSANGVTNAVSGAGATVADEQRVEEQKKEVAKDARDLKVEETWAKDQHARVTSLAKAGNCPDAAKLVASIAARAPEYYSTHVATDRNLKTCLAYITDAREKDAERANKARVQKRLDANEPSPAPSK